MSLSSNALAALEASAGVPASAVSLTIRSILLVLVFVWAGACVYSEIHHFRHHNVDAFDVLRKNSRILLVVSIAIILVFIG